MHLTTKLWRAYIFQKRQENQHVTRQRLSEAGARGAWRRWHREQQIVKLLPMVERIGRNVRWMFAAHIDFSDLKQAGAVGLVSAANSYDPSRGPFEPYAYFRVRGSIIDSQKRRAYREESNVSLHAIAEANGGALPPRLDQIDRAPRADILAEREQARRLLAAAIRELPPVEAAIIQEHLAGQSLGTTARQMGRSLRWARGKLTDARELVAARVRGA
jgi:RNA polymerase sigma factor (sigma-70 family)